ncbi:hypothetical protein [Prescottella agglutinans]|uniref:Uncharacterized protein n=1 Tax=Prescottella agglutinans TaxID=1644129 RepID=A0ABT6MGT8_9NOCA|nr:hypothetical protein [Prescottella agglutinans]MDH6283546.1 hypothetical protein [Prescottella agglutinans]
MGFTDLDMLKYLHARADRDLVWATDQISGHTETPDEFGHVVDEVTEVVDSFRDVLAKYVRERCNSSSEWGTYSDGRRVHSAVMAGHSVFGHVWHPDASKVPNPYVVEVVTDDGLRRPGQVSFELPSRIVVRINDLIVANSDDDEPDWGPMMAPY